jgi:hypothetical protein
MPLRISLFDLQGREVATLLQSATARSGEQSIDFDPARWPDLPSGEYICRLLYGTTSVTRRMVLAR